MPVVSLAVETNYHLSNNIYEADTAQEAVEHFVTEWASVTEPGDLISQIVCSSLPRDPDFESEVERLIEAALPERFVHDYIWTEARWVCSSNG